MGISNMVLRTVYIKPAVDDELRDQAFRLHTSKNDLIRKYIELGMAASKATRMPAGSAVDTKSATAKKVRPKVESGRVAVRAK
jgi:hypothetical protein